MIIDVLVTDQLNLFIVFYETYGQPEPRLCPLVVPYMAPGLSVQFLIGGSFFVIWSARGMGPLALTVKLGTQHHGPSRVKSSPLAEGPVLHKLPSQRDRREEKRS